MGGLCFEEGERSGFFVLLLEVPQGSSLPRELNWDFLVLVLWFFVWLVFWGEDFFLTLESA